MGILVESKDKRLVYAWRKIVIYSGILPITKDDAGLATVMGHEVSHALTITVRNVMSGQLQQLLVPVFLLTSGQSEKHNKYGITYGVGSQVGMMLPLVEIMKLRRIK
jgi:Zn-dependent protease with chaperone function